MLCRLCLINIDDGKQAVLLYNTCESEGESRIVRLIAKYMHLDITQQDAISTIICQECCRHLNAFHKFSEFVSEQQRSFLKELVAVKREVGSSRMEVRNERQSTDLPLDDTATMQKHFPEVQLKCEPEEEITLTEATLIACNEDNLNHDANQAFASSSLSEFFPSDDHNDHGYRNFHLQNSIDPQPKLSLSADNPAEHLSRTKGLQLSQTFPPTRLQNEMIENEYLPNLSVMNNYCDSNNVKNILFSPIFFRVIKHLDCTVFQQKRGGALVQCCVCDGKLKGSTQVTSNLIRHLKLKHPEAYEEYKRLKMVKT